MMWTIRRVAAPLLGLVFLVGGVATAQMPADPVQEPMPPEGGDMASGDPAYPPNPAALSGAPGESVDVAPPDLPNYDQPPLPGDGYVWTPGYWAWSEDDQDYYWVPGTWVQPPQPDLLWTPGYWIVQGPVFVWYRGYWGPHVGYYGGIDYGCGYGGHGYQGGYWRGNRFYYNRAVNNVGTVRSAAMYEAAAGTNTPARRHSYTGGGTNPAPATAAELAAARERHWAPQTRQLEHERIARRDVTTHLSFNQGIPAVAATPQAGALSAPGVVRARPTSGTFSVVRPESAPQSGGGAAPRTGVAPGSRSTTRPLPRGEATPRTAPGALAPGTMIPGAGRDAGVRGVRPSDTRPAPPRPPPPPQAPPVPRAPERAAEPARAPPRLP